MQTHMLRLKAYHFVEIEFDQLTALSKRKIKQHP